MTFEISLQRKIKAEKEFVFDWWTDLSPEDSKLVKPLKYREIISRTPSVVILRDEEVMYFRRMVFDVQVTLERPDRWVAEYYGEVAKARSEYVLSKADERGSSGILSMTANRYEKSGMARNNVTSSSATNAFATVSSEIETANKGTSTYTILSYHSVIQPKGFLTKLFSPVIKPFVKHVFASEMKIFIRTLESDYNMQRTTK